MINLNFLKPKNLNSEKVDWLVSEKSRTIVKQYAEYSERTENEVIDFFLTNILLDEDFITWVKKKRNNKRLLTLLGIEDPSED
ncbi:MULTISPECIES: hypothetical protein [Bacillaceae]|uniref:hypothetical protein n=1 Tax=Bacillus sp. 7894-2 TaxID=2021695 RepID=UPI0020407BC5|nr:MULTISPECIES: hypothetical protein [Bacillaceae]MCM3705864.1 hypothetical protein [Cytobacillus firmus]